MENELEERALELAAEMVKDPAKLRGILLGVSAQLDEAQAAIREMRPKADLIDMIMQSKGWEDMATIAKLLGRPGYGRNTIFAILRDRGIFRTNANNEPYQEYVNRGYFKIVEQHWENPQTGETMISKKTVVSQKGLAFIKRVLDEVAE